MLTIILGILFVISLFIIAILMTRSAGEKGKFAEETDVKERYLEATRSELKTLQERVQELEEQNKSRERLFIIMLDLARRLGENLTREQIVALLLRLAGQLFENGDEFTVFLTDEAGKNLSCVASEGLPQERYRDLVIPVGEGYIGFTAKKKVIMSTKDFEQESNIIQSRLKESRFNVIKTALCAPLIHGEKVIGTLNIGKLPGYVKDAKGMLLIIVNLGAVALENARLFDEMQVADALTGLYKRRTFKERLEQEVIRAKRFAHELSVFMFDMDGFLKYIEDNGQQAGDEVLKMVSDILKNVIRKIDIIGRYDVDRFVVLLHETGKDQALQLAEKVRRLIADCPFPHGKLTISGGIASFPLDGNEHESLIQVAETATFKARELGKNRIIGAM